MFRYRRQLRRGAGQVLFLWVFGIGAGFANACLTAQPAESMGHGSAHGVIANAADAPVGPAPSGSHHVPQVHQHQAGAGHDEVPVNANCLDFCDKSAISIPSVKSALDVAYVDVLLPAVAAIFYPVATLEPVQWWMPRHDGGLSPPIIIAFLRLAL